MKNEHPLKQELYTLRQKDISYFEFIQNGSLDGVWFLDLENPQVMWMCPRFWKTLGYESKEKKALISEWQDIIFKDDLKIALENFDKHLEDATNPYDQIVRYRHKNGSTVWIRCRGIAIRDENGKPLRMLCAHNNLTAVISLKEELISKDEMRLFNERVLQKEKKEIQINEHVFYNKETKVVHHQEKIVDLTDQEISLLELLLQNKNRLLSINEIEYLLNKNKMLTNNAIALLICRLKKKLPAIPIKNIYRQGYLLYVK
jgi:PAS domain S-box-containing protein